MALKYKVGDRVRVKSLDWYNENKNEYGNVNCSLYVFSATMRQYCGTIHTIRSVDNFDKKYKMVEDGCHFDWTDEMIECKVEETDIKPKFKVGDIIISDVFTTKNDKGWKVIDVERTGYRLISVNNSDLVCDMDFKNEHYYKLVDYVQADNIPDVIQTKTSSVCSHNDFYGYSDSEGNEISEWYLPEGYQFVDENGNIINAQKIVLEKKPDDKLKLESTKKVREYWSEYARIFIEIYDDDPNECVFTHLWVIDGQRQKGHGKRALIEAETIAKELGCHKAHLKVETNSWMHNWYLRCGYQWYKNANEGYT